MSSRSSAQFWAACSAAFACGAAAGACAVKLYYYSSSSSSKAEQQQQQGIHTIDLSALRGALNPMGASAAGSGGGLSPTASVSSFSLPPTPRFTPAHSMNGRDGAAAAGFSRSSSMGASQDNGLRMVFVVRRDLQWSKQKLAVMTAHAALALFKKLFKGRHPALAQWEAAKGPKLVLRAENEQQLLAAMAAARAAGIPQHTITEAAGSSSSGGGGAYSSSGGGSADGSSSAADVCVPRRSRTILALGPLPADQISKIAEGLVLL